MGIFLFQIWKFQFDITAIISFLIGILLGAVLICMLYAFFVLASLRNKKFIIKTDEDNLTTAEVKDMIAVCQKTFKDKDLRGDLSRVSYCKNLCVGLVYGIATRFYPKSKHPLLELSVDEAMMLTVYIENRVEEIMNRKGIRLLKRIKVSTIVELTHKTNRVMDSKAFKVTKEVNSTVSTIKKIVNVVNPAWWFRKLVIDKTLNVITNKLCLVIIAIVGEETYKIYSKTVFNKEVDIESDINDILTSIDEDLIDASKEIKNGEMIQKEEKEEPVKLWPKMKSKAYVLCSSSPYDCRYEESFPFLKREVKEDKGKEE